MNVPIPVPLPPGVSVSWSSTGALCTVWCSHCRSGNAIYTTVFKNNPDALVEAVEGHRECRAR